MDKPAKRRPKLYIVNLQWTPKDCHAALKIHGRCDIVMKKLMKHLGVDVPSYSRVKDPIFVHATELCADEQHTTTRRCLEPAPDCKEELIVITVESDPKACCDLFKQDATHAEGCANFVDASRDMPVIMAPDSTAPPIMSLMEAMFFNYLCTLIASLTSYQLPQPVDVAPVASTSKLDQDESDDDDLPLMKRFKIAQPITSKCSFCAKQYGSEACLFYAKRDAAFKSDAPACLCCGDDEVEDEAGSSSEVTGDRDEEKMEKEEKVRSPINPGWFGKGCRKKIKKKR